ncbi:protein phosphatase 2C domain-containing protein [Candidatus Dojkabacteria bacterium]|nr:protein phosphatase 2C domain-containing protein [Candidatus Dojkabacteria bacterium]
MSSEQDAKTAERTPQEAPKTAETTRAREISTELLDLLPKNVIQTYNCAEAGQGTAPEAPWAAQLSSVELPTGQRALVLEINAGTLESNSFDLQLGGKEAEWPPAEQQGNHTTQEQVSQTEPDMHLNGQQIYLHSDKKSERVLMFSTGTSAVTDKPHPGFPHGQVTPAQCCLELGKRSEHPEWDLVKVGNTMVYIHVIERPNQAREKTVQEKLENGEPVLIRPGQSLELPLGSEDEEVDYHVLTEYGHQYLLRYDPDIRGILPIISFSGERSTQTRPFSRENSGLSRVSLIEGPNRQIAIDVHRNLLITRISSEKGPLSGAEIRQQRPGRYTCTEGLHIGEVRPSQEDNNNATMLPVVVELVEDPEAEMSFVLDTPLEGPTLVIDADGMGGHEKGDVASRMVVNAVTREVTNTLAKLGNELAMKVSRICTGKTTEQLSDEEASLIRDLFVTTITNTSTDISGWCRLEDSGSTFSGALLIGETAIVANVGDTRVYLVNTDGTLTQLSEDHTSEKHRHALTQAVGNPKVKPSSSIVRLEPGQRLLLCSDGLYGDLNSPDDIKQREQMIGTILSQQSGTAAADSLISLANTIDGSDNCSVSLVEPDGYHYPAESISEEELLQIVSDVTGQALEAQADDLEPRIFTVGPLPFGKEVYIGREDPTVSGDLTEQGKYLDVAWATDDTTNSISRLHAKVYGTDIGIFIEDNGSTNGTMVNGVKLELGEIAALEKGSTVTLGEVTYVVGPGTNHSDEHQSFSLQLVRQT